MQDDCLDVSNKPFISARKNLQLRSALLARKNWSFYTAAATWYMYKSDIPDLLGGYALCISSATVVTYPSATPRSNSIFEPVTLFWPSNFNDF